MERKRIRSERGRAGMVVGGGRGLLSQFPFHYVQTWKNKRNEKGDENCTISVISSAAISPKVGSVAAGRWPTC